MKIIKTYKDKENWFETTKEEMIKRTEDIYLKPLQVFKDIGSIESIHAIWKLKK